MKYLVTLTGAKHYFGTDFLREGMKVRLVKEPKNAFDTEAIRVELEGMGLIGYVANSPYTVKGECVSAGRIYDKIGKKAKAKILYVMPGFAICKISRKSLLTQPRMAVEKV